MKGMEKWISKHGEKLQGQADAQPMKQIGRKGPKLKREPHDPGCWQQLSAQPATIESFKTRLERGDQIEIEIAKVELHQKSGQHQAVAYWEPLQQDETVTEDGRPITRMQGQRFKVVIKADDFVRWPEVGECWLVWVNSLYQTIAFAQPLEFRGNSPALEARKAKAAVKAAEERDAFLAGALGQWVDLTINLPDDPQVHWEQRTIWNQVDHYHGQLVTATIGEDGVLSVTLENVRYRRSSTDCEEGYFEGRERSLDGSRTFALSGAVVEERGWHDHESGTTGANEVLTGVNPGTRNWDEKRWSLFVY